MKARTLAFVVALATLMLILSAGSVYAETPATEPPAEAQTPEPEAAAAFNCAREDLTHIPAGECNSLVAFYNATGGGGWKNQAGWLTQNDVCAYESQLQNRWYGVGCTCCWGGGCSNPPCQVIGLQLSGNGLSGSIPSAVTGFPKLSGLYLSDDNLTGAIPAFIGSLSKLEGLNLNHNQLTGPIPASLGSLGAVTYFGLMDNDLTGAIPDSFGGMTSVKFLYLNDNNLSGPIPSSLGGLKNLEELGLYDNALDGQIPTTFGGMAQQGGMGKLRWLFLDNNALTGTLPKELGNLTSLTDLEVYSNSIAGQIPSELGNLTNLEWLDLSYNRLDGPIPASFSRLSNLEGLWLSDNLLESGLPVVGAAGGETSDQALGLSKLQVIDVSRNKLNDEIALTWGQGAPLQEVRMRGNELKGQLPSALFRIPTLEILDLGENQLTGNIPDVANLANLKELRLDHNSIGGGVPLNVDALHNLEVLDVSYNKLNRTMDWPTAFVMPDLYWLNLSHNDPGLTGEIPTSLRNAPALRMLSLEANRLTGPIPEPGAGQWQNLQHLYLGDNDLRGGIPPELGYLTNLAYLYLQGNTRLGGTIPDSLGNLTSLRELSLSNCGLSGAIPGGLGGNADLRILNLSFNSLTAQIPASFGNLTKLTKLDVRNNALSGPSPDLSRMTGLRYLYMAENRLTTLPTGLGNLTQLVEADFNHNAMTSGIPDLSRLKSLTHLYLNANNLAAPIPATLGQATALVVLDLSDNSRLGAIPKELANLKGLHTLGLAGIGATAVPKELGTLPELLYLSLQHNRLTSLPAELANLHNLTWLDVSYNQLPASALSTLSTFTSLKHLDASRNPMRGSIPLSMRDLTNLEFLDLSLSELTGSIPAWGRFPWMKYLYLSFNNLSGTIPVDLGQLPSIVELHLSSNANLGGALPRKLMDCLGLNKLNFANTQICEPSDDVFQGWLFRLWLRGGLLSTGIKCGASSVSKGIGAGGGSLSSTGDGTEYAFQAGTFGAADASVASAAVVTVTHTPMAASAAPSTGALVGIRHFYQVYAKNQSGQMMQPSLPYTITIIYSELDLRSSRAQESTLALYRWNGTTWSKEPTSRVDTAANRITATPGRFSTWAVLGKPFEILLLPDVMKEAVQ